MNQPKKILITGASGFTGKHACKHFLRQGYEVNALYKTNSITLDGARSDYCDLTNKSQIRELINKIKPQMVLHLAGQNHVGKSWENPMDSLESNAFSTLYLLEALRLEVPSCKIVIVGSSLEINPGNFSTLTHPYSLSKTLQTFIAQSWGNLFNMHIIIAKPSNLVGPGHSSGICAVLAKEIVKMEQSGKGVLNLFNLKAQRDFLDVRDAVSAYETLFIHGMSGEVYNVGSEVSRSLEEICDIYMKLSKVPFSVSNKMSEEEEKVEVDTTKLKALGWKPAIQFKQSLQDILSFSRSIR
jgi:GDP-4-dehydro-6-deoxy-D-mannose reductase